MQFAVKMLFQQMGDFHIAVPVGDESCKYPSYIQINHTCMFIVEGIVRGEQEQQIISGFMEEFGVSEEVAARDVHSVVEGFRNMGLLV